MENKIEQERAMMESLGDCPECGHDLPGVAKLIGGRWQLFCTECRMCVIGSEAYAVKCWGLKEHTGMGDRSVLIRSICDAIRAMDYKSVDESDYMLDSDDCIKLIETFGANGS